MYHEAVLRSEDSEKCLKFIHDTQVFDVIESTKNPKGQGVNITKMLKLCQSPYFIHWEDDMLALRPLNIARVYHIFEHASDVNQIAFNRRDTMDEVSGWKKIEVERAGTKLTTSPHWRYTPAMWRMSWIMPRWKCFEGNNSHWVMNDHLRNLPDEGRENPTKVAAWVMRHMGTYYLGGIGERAYCTHIGAGRSGRQE